MASGADVLGLFVKTLEAWIRQKAVESSIEGPTPIVAIHILLARCVIAK